jgi:phage terminase large subunit
LFRGLSVAWAWVDEGGLCSEELWKVVLGRLRQSDPQAWITTTPQGFNWLFDFFVEAENPEYGYVRSATAENNYLPPEYLQSLEANYSGSFHDQELLGAFTAPSGLVYPEFDRRVHMVDPFPIPGSWKKVGGIDFGYYHPLGCLWAAFDGDGTMFIYREYREAQRLLKDHAAVLRSEPGVTYYISDHDSQDRSELHALGIGTRAAAKDVVQGLQSVQGRLKVQGNGKPRLYVFKSCPKLAREFSMYSWHQSQSVISDAEKVMKIGDDLLDCLRYISYYEDRLNRRASFPPLAAMLGY